MPIEKFAVDPSPGKASRVPAIGPHLLVGTFGWFWWITGPLVAAVLLMVGSFVLAMGYDGLMGHSR